MKKLIGISGKMYSGKDTVALMIKQVCTEFEVKRFAGKLKQVAEMFTGIPANEWNSPAIKDKYLGDGWGMTGREFLQRFGTNAVRDCLHVNAWVNALFANYAESDFWIIPDTRFPNEFEAIKKRGGIVIRVERQGLPVNDHPSETSLDNFEFDYTIVNDGSIDDLRARVFEVLTNISEPVDGAYAD